MRELPVLRLELVLHCAELLQLPAELERREERVLAGEGNERWADQGLVDVEARARVTETVHVCAERALHAVAAHGVWLRYGDTSLKKQLDDLIVVDVSREDDWSDIWGKI